MNTIDNESPKVVTPLGRALHNARLAAPFSVEEVALQLNLNISTVIDLELELQNTIENKTYAVIYLRGYLSNYARLVGLENLEQYPEYQQLSIPEKNNVHLTKMISVSRRPKNRKKFIVPTVIAVCVLVASGFVIQQFLSSDSKPLADINAVEKSSVEIKGTSTDTTNNIPVVKREIVLSEAQQIATQIEQVEQETSTTETIDVEPSDPETEPNVKPEVAPEVLPEAIPNIEAQDEVSNTPDSIATETTTANSDSNKADATIKTKVASVADGVTKKSEKIVVESLNLSFSGDSWTEIFDASGDRLAFALYKDGSALTVNGQAPFKLKLGDPSVVEIHYQDEKVERVLPAGRTARITIPG